MAAGGILNAQDIKRAVVLGADGVQMGTRFALSWESNFSPQAKMKLLEAGGTKVITSPLGLPARVIDSQKVESLPKMKDIAKCEQCLKICNREYCILSSLREALPGGDVERALIFSGVRIGEIKDILKVEEIFQILEGDL